MNRSTVYLAAMTLALTACSKCNESDKEKSPTSAESPSSSGPVAIVASVSRAATEFKPTKDGFKFQNYGNEKGYKNLTPTELKRMFGPEVCAVEENGECTLTPPAAAWLEEMNKGMGGGHCEGFAALSLLFQRGLASPKDFGAPTTFDLDIDGNDKLQREIAYWFVTQAVSPMSGAEDKTLTPNQVVDKLAADFASKKESWTLGIYMPGYSAGHAITPYAVKDHGGGVSWIMIYDNNFPGAERHVEVDREKNVWKYFTAANPNEEGAEYVGDATTFTLTIAPTSVRVGKMSCSFCGNVAPDGAPEKGSRQVILDGDADLLITDESGHRLGHEGGKLVNDIPGASYANMRGYLSSHHEPIYNLPTGTKLRVTLDGSALKKEDGDEVALFGPGYTLEISDISLKPGQKDEVDFSADWSEVSYKTQGNETPVVSIGIETLGPDYLFAIKSVGEADGQQIDLLLDVKKGTIALQVHGKAGKSAYSIQVSRFDKGGAQVFSHKGLAVGSSEVLYFSYGEWKGNHQPMKLAVDKNHDGSIDATETLIDED